MELKSSDVDDYGLSVEFEVAVVALCVACRGFWARIGSDIDPEAFQQVPCQWALRGCAAVANDGAKPSPLVVAQRLQRWHEEGRIEAAELRRARLLILDAMEDVEDLDTEAVRAELAPVLKQHAERVALDVGLRQVAKQGDLVLVERLLAKARRIGEADTSSGMRFCVSEFESATSGVSKDMLPTGIEELDGELQGGLRWGTLNVILASTGIGKSMALDHIAAEALTKHHSAVALATLELSANDHFCRVLSNIVEVPITDLIKYPDDRRRAEERFCVLEEAGMLGFFTLKDFTPRATTVDEIIEWLAAEEEIAGHPIKLLLLDYASLLCEPGHGARHAEMTAIAEKLRAVAKSRDMVIVTPHQATGEGMNTNKVQRLDAQHSADSKGIPRTADLLVSLNPRDNGTMILFYIAKNRHGEGGQDVGPLPVDFAHGRVSMFCRSGNPW